MHFSDMHIQALIQNFLARKRLLGPPSEVRTFGPICDAIEVGNYKLALNICSKSLRKSPISRTGPAPPPLSPVYILLSLQCLCQLKLSRPSVAGSSSGATSVPDSVSQTLTYLRSTPPYHALSDPDVLLFLQVVLSDLHFNQPLKSQSEMMEILELATKHNPDSEEVGVEAFVFYVRCGEYGRANKVGMRLSKVVKGANQPSSSTSSSNQHPNKYFWWTVMTAILQARKEDEDSKIKSDSGTSAVTVPAIGPKALLLSLVSRMLAQHLEIALSFSNQQPHSPSSTATPSPASRSKSKQITDGRNGTKVGTSGDNDDDEQEQEQDGSSELIIGGSNSVSSSSTSKGKKSTTKSVISGTNNGVTTSARAPSKSKAFETQHEFYAAARVIELRLRAAVETHATTANNANASSNTGAAVIPTSSSTTAAATTTTTTATATDVSSISSTLTLPPHQIPPTVARQALFDLFDSEEGKSWCEKGLGLEIWRRDLEVEFWGIGGDDGGGNLDGESGGAGADTKVNLNAKAGLERNVDGLRKCWERMKGLLRSGDTNWHTFLTFIKCGILSSSSSQDLSLLEESRKFLTWLSEVSPKSKSGKERGYLLGRVELESRATEVGLVQTEPSSSTPSCLQLAKEYISQFGDKIACYDDLRPHLVRLAPGDQKDIVAHLSSIYQLDQFPDHEQTQRLINACKMIRLLLDPTELTRESEKTHAEEALRYYFNVLPVGKGLPETELQPADDLAGVAAEAFVSAWRISRESGFLERAAAVLEFALRRSKYKYQLRMLVIRIYRLLGAPSLALSHYRQLESRGVQNDSVGHWILDRISTFSLVASGDMTVSAELGGTLKAGRQGEAETAEMMVRAFTYQNYTKIEDFVDFRSKLARSIQRRIALVEHGRINPRQSLDKPVDKSRSQTSFLSDNRDFSVLPNYQPYRCSSILEDTSMGPKITESWISNFAMLYEGEVSSTSDLSELTNGEKSLLSFCGDVQRLALNPGDSSLADAVGTSAQELADTARRQFETKSVEGMEEVLPWELLHWAQICCEASQHLDHYVDRLLKLKSADAPDPKRIRQLRNSAREEFRSVSTLLTRFSSEEARAAKVVERISDLNEFGLLDEDFVQRFSERLTESQRKVANGVAKILVKKTSS